MKKYFGMVTVLLAVFLMGCKKEGCTDITAENYDEKAKTDDGTCSYQRDVFLGIFNVKETCAFEDDRSYTVKVLAGPNTNEIIIENLYNEGQKVRATVANNEAKFKEDIVGLTYEGTAFMVGEELNVSYEVCETYYYPCSDPESCSFTGVK